MRFNSTMVKNPDIASTSLRAPVHRHARRLAIFALLLAAGGCDTHAGALRSVYTPRTRAITVTTVPLLVREQAGLFPFLKQDFATGGVLEGKEVYAFSPSSITVVEGDTIQFTFYNPEDDVHSFVLPDLAVPLPPQKVTTATYVAKHRGIYSFVCSVASHLPMMSGQLVVLAPEAMR